MATAAAAESSSPTVPFGTADSEPRDIEVALRVFTRPRPTPRTDEAGPERARAGARAGSGPAGLRWVLTFDTETTTDTAQQLNFGAYRLAYRYGTERIITVEEGVFYADNLPTRDPEGYRTLLDHVTTRRADVSPGRHRTGDTRTVSLTQLQCYSRRDWVKKVLFEALKVGAVVVGFNLPFDLARIAVDAGAGRGDHFGAFSFRVWDNEMYFPRIIVRSLDSRKSLISTAGMAKRPPGWREPRFLDLRTFTAAISGAGHSLDSACREWKVEHPKTEAGEHGRITDDYIAYCRRDVQATLELLDATLTVFYDYKIPGLTPDKAYSGASLSKATLRGLGVLPPLERNPDFPADILGASMEAFYGGRSEVRARRVHVPAQVHDFTSMYPTVNTLTGLWNLLTADTITADDATDEVRDLLDRITVDDCYEPSTWPNLVGIAQIIAGGDVLPVRGSFEKGRSPVIGLNPLHSDRPTWYTIADLVASKILTGKTPTILRAVRFTGHGKAETLKSSTLSTQTIDPATDDLFRSVIELRKSVDHPTTQNLLKLIANAGAYGIFSEFIGEPHAADDPVTVDVSTGDTEFSSSQTTSERPGAYCFPPIAATITGAARLMLALLEKAVTDAGGWWVFCDTDSMAVITDDAGSLIPCPGGPHLDPDGRECVRALTPETTAAIRSRFDTQLNPYNRSIVPQLLKHEYTATVYAVSAKRYATYRIDDAGRVAHVVDTKGKPISLGKQHGVGWLLPPGEDRDDPDCPLDLTNRGWIDTLWATAIERDLGIVDRFADLGAWEHRAARSRLTITSPHMLARVDRLNDGKSWDDSIKPFGFLSMTASTGICGAGVLVAPYSTDAAAVRDSDWLAMRTGVKHRVHVGPDYDWDADADLLDLDTFARIVREHDRSPETKYLGADGRPCGPDTRGVLLRQPVRARWHRHIGKEIRTLDECEHLAVPTPSLDYARNGDDWDEALDVLRVIGVRGIRRHLPLVCEHHHWYDTQQETDLASLRDRYETARTAATRTRITGLIDDRINRTARQHRDHDRDHCPRVSDQKLRDLLRDGSTARPRDGLRRRLIQIAEIESRPTCDDDEDTEAECATADGSNTPTPGVGSEVAGPRR